MIRRPVSARPICLETGPEALTTRLWTSQISTPETHSTDEFIAEPEGARRLGRQLLSRRWQGSDTQQPASPLPAMAPSTAARGHGWLIDAGLALRRRGSSLRSYTAAAEARRRCVTFRLASSARS